MAEGFWVDIGALDSVTATTKQVRGGIQDINTALAGNFRSIETAWVSRSGNTFKSLAKSFEAVARDLDTLLGDAIRRLEGARANYVAGDQVGREELTPR